MFNGFEHQGSEAIGDERERACVHYALDNPHHQEKIWVVDNALCSGQRSRYQKESGGIRWVVVLVLLLLSGVGHKQEENCREPKEK